MAAFFGEGYWVHISMPESSVQEQRRARKIRRTGYRTGATEEDKAKALSLALSRLPRRRRRTFLDTVSGRCSSRVDRQAAVMLT